MNEINADRPVFLFPKSNNFIGSTADELRNSSSDIVMVRDLKENRYDVIVLGQESDSKATYRALDREMLGKVFSVHMDNDITSAFYVSPSQGRGLTRVLMHSAIELSDGDWQTTSNGRRYHDYEGEAD